MGSGVALAIKEKWPKVFNEYCDFCDLVKDEKQLLGKANIVEVVENELYVSNCFGQYNTSNSMIATIYNKLEESLEETFKFAIEKNLTIYVPFLIGCGVAGGDFKTVIKIILKLEQKYEIETISVLL